MKMSHWLLLSIAFFGAACARIQVEAPKDPIKMDISMRLDVYQHVVKDIDAIESIVQGKNETTSAMAQWLVGTAWADELSPAIRDAALRRRARLSQISDLERRGVLGEDRMGLLSVRQNGSDEASALARDENKDRLLTFEEVARAQGTDVDSVRKVYAERLQNQAPSGTPIETTPDTWSAK